MNHDERGIFELDYQRERLGNYISSSLAQELTEFFPMNKPVYDLGCGTGEYLEVLQNRGYRVQGFEGTPGIRSIANVNITEFDLTEPLPEPTERGSVLCIEVGEHIPKEFENTFIDNIDRYTDKHLVVSWAKPGQGGVGHVNEKTAYYILATFKNLGFTFDKQRSLTWRALAGKELRWLQHTLFVFER